MDTRPRHHEVVAFVSDSVPLHNRNTSGNMGWEGFVELPCMHQRQFKQKIAGRGRLGEVGDCESQYCV